METDTFIQEVFEAEVLRDVIPKYGTVNPCTIFYEATDKIEGLAAPWEFTTLAAKLACARYIEKLANRAFSSLWGLKDSDGDWLESGAMDAALKLLDSEVGCHEDISGVKYAIMRRLRLAEKQVKDLLEET